MRIAVAQTPGTQLSDWRVTLARLEHLIAEAAARQAELVVLPECAWPAYYLESRKAYDAARATGLPAPGVFLDHVRQAARDTGLYLCVGYVEEAQSRLFNSACLIDPRGEILGTHRKCFLWDFDHDYFTTGDRIEPIQTPLGRVGLMICADARLPEIPATLAARGAELILQPTGWVNAGSTAALWNPQPDFLIAARAREFGIPIASASKWGVEGNTTFVGSSLICDATGQVRTRCSEDRTVVQIANVHLGKPRPIMLTDAEQHTLRDPDPPKLPSAHTNTVLVLGTHEPGGGRLELSAMGPGESFTPLATFATHDGDDERAPCVTARDDFVVVDETCVGTLSAAQLERFAAARSLALRGVHLAVVFGIAEPTDTLRARACENRLFLLGIDKTGWIALAPSGSVLHASSWRDTGESRRRLILDLRQAANKCVAPQTDVLADRTPEVYAL